MGKSYSVFYLLIDVEGRDAVDGGGKQFEEHIETLISEYMRQKFDQYCTKPYIVRQPNIKVGSSTKRADLVVWVKNQNGDWMALLIECKNYEGTYIGEKTINQIVTYKNNLKACDGSNVKTVVPMLCCRTTTKYSSTTTKRLSDYNISKFTFSRDSFVNGASTSLNNEEEAFCDELFEQILQHFQN